VRAKLLAAGIAGAVKLGAVYVTDTSKALVDYWHEVVAMPRVFEWNIMKHHVLEKTCVDIDGVLCRDPSADENDDGPLYERFIETVKPLIVPQREIGWLVTCRLERYRSSTEQWLHANGFRYRQLVMMDLPDKATRQAANGHARFKASLYRESGARLLIESSSSQAIEIARLTGKDVYSVDAREMIRPGLKSIGVHQPRAFVRMVLQATAPGRRLLDLYRRSR
jgi:orotate phosphoribosyltransferase